MKKYEKRKVFIANLIANKYKKVMFFFIFAPPVGTEVSTYAGQAFLEAVSNRKTTFGEVAAQMGMSRIVLTKFLNGRPPSPGVLRALLKVFSGKEGEKILVGHLLDEISRGGKDPNDFVIMCPRDFKNAMELVATKAENSEKRRAELIELVLKWQREDLVSTVTPGTAGITCSQVVQSLQRPKRGRKRNAAKHLDSRR